MALTKVNRGGLNTGVTDASDATAITIDSSEQVGIGTSSPTRQLTVQNTIANSGGVIGLTSSDSSTSGTCGIIHFGNSTDSSLASINGIAAGAGANLAISCDVTFAASSAKFIQSFINIGLVPDSGGTYNLPRLIGKQRAAGLMFSGEKISSAEAEKIGMIYKSVDDENGYQLTLDFAKKISEKPTKSIGLIKSLLNKSNKNRISEQLELEKKYQITAANSSDHKEGVKAFFEKRKPKYIGE